MADVRLAVGVWDKIGDKCLVEILRFAVIMEFFFFFQNEILNLRISDGEEVRTLDI